jgi:hypothetical protein
LCDGALWAPIHSWLHSREAGDQDEKRIQQAISLFRGRSVGQIAMIHTVMSVSVAEHLFGEVCTAPYEEINKSGFYVF